MTEMRREPRAAVEPARWTARDAEELYGIPSWGQGVFGITPDGHLAVFPEGNSPPHIDLYDVVESLRERGLHPPVLIRLYDVLAARLRGIRAEFDSAIERRGYSGRYRCVYPIKVNQERHLCEEIRDFAEELDFGFEAGSKPELLAVLGLTAGHPKIPILCNGFKDEEFLETVTLATKLRRDIVPIVESPHELEVILEMAERHSVRPRIGIRMKLHSAATGHWEASGGAGSKFGLHASEMLWAINLLDEHGMTDCLQLLHCHVGSQVSRLESLRAPFEELARTYVELKKRGTGVSAIDIGGGLGVDYDGTNSGRGSSVDYDVGDYAELVVSVVGDVCDASDVPHPDIFSESGRAMVAASSVLVVDVLARRRSWAPAQTAATGTDADADLPDSIEELRRTAEELPDLDTMHAQQRAKEALDRVSLEYRNGELSLQDRARAEELFARIARRLAERGEDAHQDLVRSSAAAWGDLYIGNFSLFQSVPDSWALDQVFPICPIHRLLERPNRAAVLGDITCDSDGRIDRFSLHGAVRRTLDVHRLEDNKPYYLGVFLVGAYQEILGDLHNLFGDAHAVHVRVDEAGEWMLEEVVVGDTVRDVLGYVHYEPMLLLKGIRREVESAIRRKILTVAEGKELLSNIVLGLDGYTYLE